MKRLVALLAGAIAVAAVLFLSLGGGSKAETKPSTEHEAPVAARSVAPTAAPRLASAAPVVKTDAVEHANVDGLPDALEPGYLAVEQAAKTCRSGRPAPKPIRPNGPDETIESIQLSYRQVSSGGVGRIEDLKVSDGKLTDQALQSCIVKAAASASWKSDAPDRLIGTLQQNVNVGDLMRPDFGLPPESRRSPKPTAPPPPELAGPLGQQAPEVEDDHKDVIVAEPGVK